MPSSLQSTAQPDWISAAREWLAANPAVETAAGLLVLLTVAWITNVWPGATSCAWWSA